MIKSGVAVVFSNQQEGGKGERQAAQQKVDASTSAAKKAWTKPPAVDGCTDKDERCEFWAEIGECDKNPGFMRQSCAASCGTCKEAMMPYEERCLKRFAKEMSIDVVKPHQLHRIMRAALEDKEVPGTLLHEDPPVIHFESFISATEADQLIELGHGGAGYEKSSTVGAEEDDGTLKKVFHSARTSSNNWCNQEPCKSNSTVTRVTERIARVSQVQTMNHEYLQLLSYDPGQYYKEHHDYIHFHQGKPSGPRIYTLFIYLSVVHATLKRFSL